MNTQEWVSIADRWPPKKTSVLVATSRGLAVCEWGLVAGIPWWTPTAVYGEYGYECLLEAQIDFRDSDKAVTHWMPLPEPPAYE